MSTLAATVAFRHDILETLDTDELPGLGSRSITYGGFNTTFSLNSGSSVVPYIKYVAEHTDSVSLDFTNLDDPVTGIQNATGYRLLALLVNNTDEVNKLTISPGTSNGYDITNGADSIVLYPGQICSIYYDDQAELVDSTHKNVDFTFSLVATTTTTTPTPEKTFQISLLFGL